MSLRRPAESPALRDDDAGAGASATIGYQDGNAGFGDVQFSFGSAGAVSNGSVLSLLIEPRVCTGDVDEDGDVGFSDLTLVLQNWGPCPPPCGWDVDHSGAIEFGDVAMLLLNWGACPGPS